MPLVRQRLLLMSSGAVIGLALVIAGALLWQTPVARIRAHVRCFRYFLIPVEHICGQNVYWTNPDGSRVLIGKTSQMMPMPRPQPFVPRSK